MRSLACTAAPRSGTAMRGGFMGPRGVRASDLARVDRAMLGSPPGACPMVPSPAQAVPGPVVRASAPGPVARASARWAHRPRPSPIPIDPGFGRDHARPAGWRRAPGPHVPRHASPTSMNRRRIVEKAASPGRSVRRRFGYGAANPNSIAMADVRQVRLATTMSQVRLPAAVSAAGIQGGYADGPSQVAVARGPRAGFEGNRWRRAEPRARLLP